MRGRYPSGPDFVDQLPGSAVAKRRFRVILETIAGLRRIQDACEYLDLSEPRMYQLRVESFTGAIAALEPGQAGRPRHTLTPEQIEIVKLKQQLADMEVELKAAQARAEIAVILPKVQHSSPSTEPEPEKKTRRRHQPTRQTRGRRKNT